MVLQIPDVLNAEQVAQARRLLESAEWVDGRVTAGHQSARAKDNLQLPEDHPVARQLGEVILGALSRNPLFVSAALPLRVFPPLFNCYRGGQSFGNHVDNAIRQARTTGDTMRTDLSATLFLTESGRIRRRRADGRGHLRRALGQAAVGAHGAVSRVEPAQGLAGDARGMRIASFFWIQSMLRDDGERTLLFDLDTAIQRLTVDLPEHPAAVQLTSVYHNLLRRWAEV